MGEIVIIAAAAENNTIGKDNDLMWHLPDDFRRFKKLTTGHPMIMGRKTFESFPKPLPKRRHIIITRDKNYRVDHPQCTVVHSMDEALSATEDAPLVFIIGGGEIYEMGMDLAHRMELTRVHSEFDGDTYFPEFEEDNWKLIKEEYHPRDERHRYDFTYLTYLKAT